MGGTKRAGQVHVLVVVVVDRWLVGMFKVSTGGVSIKISRLDGIEWTGGILDTDERCI